MQPSIDVLGLSLKTFGLMFALGFLVSGTIIRRRLREWKLPEDWAYEVTFSALVGGLVGARLYYVAQHTSELSDAPLKTLFGGSGLVWYGGAIGGAIGVGLWSRRRGLFDLRLLDLCATSLALGYAIGRIGCQLSGDGDYGKPWDGPWAMAYPKGVVPTTAPVHPTPVYETVSMALVAWLLWRHRDRVRLGVLFAWYLVAAGTERFGVEFLRRNTPDVAGLTLPQVESLAMLAAGVVWLLVVRGRPGGLRANGELAPAGRSGTVRASAPARG